VARWSAGTASFIEKARFLATQARDKAPHYQHTEIGYNYRLSNVCAGIGRGQLRYLDDRVKSRRSTFDYYQKNLGNGSDFQFLPEPDGVFSNRWLTTVLLKTPGITPEKVRLALEERNIECRPLWKPMHLQPVFKNAPYYGDRLSERLFNEGLCLPSGSALDVVNLGRIVAGLKSRCAGLEAGRMKRRLQFSYGVFYPPRVTKTPGICIKPGYC